MGFVQMIEYSGADLDAVKQVNEKWVDDTEGKRTARRILLAKYRDGSDKVCELVFFDSHEDAMRNNDLPETQEYAKQIRDVTQGEPRFVDLDVVEELL
jgi:hypothetical protein